MYFYLFHNKYEVLYAFKVFKAKVEQQCEKQIKIVRSDKGGEFKANTLKMDKHLVLLQSFFKSMVLWPNTPCLTRQIKMVWLKEEIEH